MRLRPEIRNFFPLAMESSHTYACPCTHLADGSALPVTCQSIHVYVQHVLTDALFLHGPCCCTGDHRFA